MACRISELVLGCRDPELPACQTGEEQWPVLIDSEGNEFRLLKARLNAL